MFLKSDNTAGAAPEILAALLEASAGHAQSYGEDALTARLEARLAEVFERDCAVFPVVTGTAANSLAFAAITPPWGLTYCHETAHVLMDECGAPEAFAGGGRLAPLPGAQGKIEAAALARALQAAQSHGVHQNRPSGLTLSNLTEWGAVWRPEEIAALTAVARAGGLKTHLDGARFANALVATGEAPADMTWRAGVDLLSLGGTKNGCLAAEALVVFDPELADSMAYRRKRAGHLLSKHRFLSAQLLAWLEGGLWLDLAARANAMAARLAEGLRALPEARILGEVEGNMIFVELPRALHEALEAAGARYYLWAEESPESPRVTLRLVTGFATQEAEIDGFLKAARGA